MVDKTLLKVKKLSNKKTKTGENLKSILAYNGISLWRFIESPVRLILKGKKGKKIMENEILVDIICISIKFLLITKFLFRAVLGRLVKKNPVRDQSNQGKIIVSSPLDKWGETINTFTLKPRKGDTILGNVIEVLKKEGFTILGLDRDDSSFIDMKRFFDKIIYGRVTWRPIETYITLSMITKALSTTKKMEKNWEAFLQALRRDDKKLFDSLSGEFKTIFVYHIFQAIMYIELTKRVIEIEKPRLMLIACENSDSGRSMVIAGKMTKTPILAIQHGYFTDDFIRYFHESKEISDKISPQYVQISDRTAVFGSHFKKLLTQISNFPPKNIVITGQPRYDILTKANEIFSREEFCKKHNISSEKKIALVTTQPLPVLEDREIFLRDVVRALSNFDDIEIVIKPHPEEKESWHKKIMREEKAKATVLSKTYNTYKALYACDVMITISSTTALEAMILGKDVIIADLTNYPFAKSLMKSSATLRVKGKKKLVPAIEKVLYDKKTKTRLKKGRNKFVYQYAYKQDGKATQRVVSLAKRMLKKSKR